MADGLAIYAAVLSTITAVWEISSIYRNRPSLEVDVNLYQLIGNKPFRLPKDYASPQDCHFGLDITNTGKEAITIYGASIELETPIKISDELQKLLSITDERLPKTLAPGESHTILSPGSGAFVKQIRRATISDSRNKKWGSREWPLTNI